MKLSYVFVLFALAMFITGCSQKDIDSLNQVVVLLNDSTTVPIAVSNESGVVVHVVDGDTIDVKLSSGVERVRLICVDTPERGKPGFGEATNFTKLLVMDKVVTLEKDVSETDRYGRLLRYVYIGGDSVNRALVAGGYARVYRYPPDVAHCDEYESLEVVSW